MNVIGEPVDERGPIKSKKTAPIHAAPPAFADQAPTPQILETGIKVRVARYDYFPGKVIPSHPGHGSNPACASYPVPRVAQHRTTCSHPAPPLFFATLFFALSLSSFSLR